MRAAGEEEEEQLLNVVLFATRCVEEVSLSSDRYNHTPHRKKKKQQQRIAPYSGSSNNNKLTGITYQSRRKRGLWNADGELILWNNISVLVGNFERHLWVLVPLHPSVFQEDNIKFALMGQQSERMDDFPLMFNVNVAMACGTSLQHTSLLSLLLTFFATSDSSHCCMWWGAALKLVGNEEREVEFMMRARHHLEYLFDSSHIEVAEGLMCMAYYSLCQV